MNCSESARIKFHDLLVSEPTPVNPFHPFLNIKIRIRDKRSGAPISKKLKNQEIAKPLSSLCPLWSILQDRA
jgi:hypothetical protein